MKKTLQKLTSKTRNLVKLSLVASLMLGATMLSAQTLAHSYTFDTDVSDGTGIANGTLHGGASVSDGALQLATNGDYVSFVGTDLNLNAYTSITQEFVFKAAPNSNGEFMWQWTSYFGDNGGGNSMMTTLGSWGSKDYVFKQNNDAAVNVVDKSYDDGEVHHMVTVMTPTALKMYRDGVLIGETAVSDSNIGTAESFLGKGSDAWSGDPTWMGVIDEYNIYDGEMDAETVASRAVSFLGASITVSKPKLLFNEANTVLTFDVSASGLSQDITLLSPSGISLDITTIPLANAETPTTVTATWDASANIINQEINIFSGYDASANVNVIASIDSPCFTPLDANLNLISDPTVMDRSNFGGWGDVTIAVDAEGACGVTSALLTITGEGTYSNGGCAFDINGITFAPNTQYGLQAKMKTVGGHIAFKLINGGADTFFDDNSNSPLIEVNTSDAWVTISNTFTTGADPTNLSITFNSADLVTNAFASEVHIDNLELYDMATLSVDTPIKNTNVRVYPNPAKNVLNIDTSSNVSKLNIYDVFGRTVISKDNFGKSNLKSIDVSNLSSGTYILHATIDNQNQVIKFIK